MTVAVSTGGACPALAAWLRRRVAQACGEGLGALAGVLEEARRTLKATGRSTASLTLRTACSPGRLGASVNKKSHGR